MIALEPSQGTTRSEHAWIAKRTATGKSEIFEAIQHLLRHTEGFDKENPP
jgi:hypothetical protein